MLTRSESGLHLIMEDTDELVDPVGEQTGNSFEDINITMTSPVVLAPSSDRPQSRKLYLGADGISDYGVHSTSSGNATPVAIGLSRANSTTLKTDGNAVVAPAPLKPQSAKVQPFYASFSADDQDEVTNQVSSIHKSSGSGSGPG